ncbi:hypothetical protein ACROYT_G035886 [Oculina patagonica]
MFSNTTSPLSHNSTIAGWTTNTAKLTFEFATATVLAVLAPVAVAGNALILAAIWKKTFVRTPFHILLSGLAVTDLCTGLIAQPLSAAATLVYGANPDVENDRSLLVTLIGECSTIYFISITILLITLMSVERWLHMSRRSLVTSRRGFVTVIMLLLIPIPTVVYRVIENVHETQARNIYIMTISQMLASSDIKD